MGLLNTTYSSQNNSHTNNSVRINAVSGTLTKTFDKSYFITCQIGSSDHKKVMDFKSVVSRRTGVDYNNGWQDIEVVVLQAMLCGNDYVMYELIDKKDYEELLETKPI